MHHFARILLALVLAAFAWPAVFTQPAHALVQIPNNTKQWAQAMTNKSVSQPKTLTIPRLGIQAKIEGLGVNQQGVMLAPSNPDNVAWFKDGPRPGQSGNAVISGHLNSRRGAEVFWNLRKVKKGDMIYVTDAKNKKYAFRVKEIKKYSWAQAPLDQITGVSEKTNLNLVTCTGYWIPWRQNYSHRLVVYTEIVYPNAPSKPTRLGG